MAELRRLGPELAPGQVLLILDEVLTPAREPGRFHELRTAYLLTADGRRYLCGTGGPFLVQVLAAVRACYDCSLLVLADGARWIRRFYQRYLAHLPQAIMLLDWHHLKETCRDLAGQICRGRGAKARALVVRRLLRRLWPGDVPRALRLVAASRAHAQDPHALDTLRRYLQERAAWIPNYRARRRARQYIGSGLGEKANDRLVARRQKRGGMQWSAQTSVALATLRTVLLNETSDTYWQDGHLRPLCAA